VVFQSPCLLPWLSALDNVLLGVDQVFAPRSRKQRRENRRPLPALVGLGDALEKKSAELSAGDAAAVGIARAFALSPRCCCSTSPSACWIVDPLRAAAGADRSVGPGSQDRLMVTHE
jgi:ABC-type taurine transport system ATPase subunit